MADEPRPSHSHTLRHQTSIFRRPNGTYEIWGLTERSMPTETEWKCAKLAADFVNEWPWPEGHRPPGITTAIKNLLLLALKDVRP